MNTDIRPLQVTRVIVHDVPSPIVRGRQSEVTYSDVESPLDVQSANYFRQRTIGSLRSAGLDVRFATDTSSPVPELLSSYLINQDTNGFVEMSQKIAQHLYNSQTAVNSPGLLCVAEVQVGATQGLAILKLNRVGAVRLEQTQHQGNTTYSLRLIRDLILPAHSKVFKTGLFLPEVRSDSTIDVKGSVSDNQRGYAPASQVATFFLKGFLGCELIESPKGLTKRFFDAAEEWVSEISDPELRAQYEIALLAELNNERVTVSPQHFAETNLQTDDQQHFKDWLQEQEVDSTTFPKDTQLIKNRLRRMNIAFESGIGVSVPPEAMEEGYAKLSKGRDDLTRLEIEDRLHELRGK